MHPFMSIDILSRVPSCHLFHYFFQPWLVPFPHLTKFLCFYLPYAIGIVVYRADSSILYAKLLGKCCLRSHCHSYNIAPFAYYLYFCLCFKPWTPCLHIYS